MFVTKLFPRSLHHEILMRLKLNRLYLPIELVITDILPSKEIVCKLSLL